MQFEDGPSATLTMHGHSHMEGRTTRIEGSRASLQAFLGMGGPGSRSMSTVVTGKSTLIPAPFLGRGMVGVILP